MRVGSDSGFEWEKGRNLTVNMDTRLRPLNFNIVSVGGLNACNQIFLHPGFCSKSASD